MDVFTFALLATLTGCSIPLSRIWLNRQRGADADALHAVDGEIEALRERIATLEEIVTDQKFQLKRDLNQLEDVS